MRIEHIAMYVENLEDAKNFFIKYFNAVPSEKYHNNVAFRTNRKNFSH